MLLMAKPSGICAKGGVASCQWRRAAKFVVLLLTCRAAGERFEQLYDCLKMANGSRVV